MSKGKVMLKSFIRIRDAIGKSSTILTVIDMETWIILMQAK